MLKKGVAAETALQLLLAVSALLASGAEIAGAPAYYPRVIPTPTLARDAWASLNITALAAVERPTSTARRIALLAQANGAWGERSTIVEDADTTADLANPMLLLLPNGTLLCAFRHHTGPSLARIYRIGIAASTDAGASWSVLPPVISSSTGVWEPFLFIEPHSGLVSVLYAAEITNGGEQDIAMQQSTDGGASWGPVSSRIHTPFSRNGMPGVAALPDKSLLAVFEGFWTGKWDAYTVNSARSFDGGQTWGQRQIVHAPSSSEFDSGSPQIALCPSMSLVCTVYMSNEGSTSQEPPTAWPNGAHLASNCAPLSTTNISAPINWASSQQMNLTTPTSAFWPSFFLQQSPSLAALPVYQADDGSAQMLDNSVCV